MQESEIMNRVVSLCKRRGFVFQSSEIYGGLKSCYDYGPLGVELKKNISDLWWSNMVRNRDNVVGLDASIIMHPKVWETSGHLAGFSDPLVDCHDCKTRFRADKAPIKEAGSAITYQIQPPGQKKQKIESVVGDCGYVCPQCGSPNLSDERQFNLMFQTGLGPVDPLEKIPELVAKENLQGKDLLKAIREAIATSAVYLRPETAQGIFVQFLNVSQSMSMKVPFGIAQTGKSFRNEIVTEHFIFRSCEFEQMEMEFFCEPGTQVKWMGYWKEERINWYKQFANHPENFRLRQHDKDELAHYSDDCYDVEYQYPWGWDELEGVASRTDYDLKKHAAATGTKLSYFDQQKQDPETGKNGWRYVPYVIEPAAGLTRSVLCFLCDAYSVEKGVDAKGVEKERVILKLHPKLAPYKVAVLPLLKKDGHPELAAKVAKALGDVGLIHKVDDAGSIGKRYSKHDEIGTPFAVTIDGDTVSDQTVTVRHRDTANQEKVHLDKLQEYLVQQLSDFSPSRLT